MRALLAPRARVHGTPFWVVNCTWEKPYCDKSRTAPPGPCLPPTPTPPTPAPPLQVHIFLLALVNNWVYLMEWPEQGSAFASPYFNYTYDPALVAGRTIAEISYVGCPERVELGVCPLGMSDTQRNSEFAAAVTFVRINRGGIRWGGEKAHELLKGLGLAEHNRAGAYTRTDAVGAWIR